MNFIFIVKLFLKLINFYVASDTSVFDDHNLKGKRKANFQCKENVRHLPEVVLKRIMKVKLHLAKMHVQNMTFFFFFYQLHEPIDFIITFVTS